MSARLRYVLLPLLPLKDELITALSCVTVESVGGEMVDGRFVLYRIRFFWLPNSEFALLKVKLQREPDYTYVEFLVLLYRQAC